MRTWISFSKLAVLFLIFTETCLLLINSACSYILQRKGHIVSVRIRGKEKEKEKNEEKRRRRNKRAKEMKK